MGRINNNLQHISSNAKDTVIDNSTTVFDSSVTDVQKMAEAFDELAIGVLPDADETFKGITRIATEQEVLDGIEPFAYVTPLTLQEKWERPAATETTTGIVRFATTAEREFANANGSLALNTLGVWNLVRNDADSKSSEARRGTVQLATDADGITGLDTEKAMTPANVKAAIGAWSTDAIVPASEIT